MSKLEVEASALDGLIEASREKARGMKLLRIAFWIAVSIMVIALNLRSH